MLSPLHPRIRPQACFYSRSGSRQLVGVCTLYKQSLHAYKEWHKTPTRVNKRSKKIIKSNGVLFEEQILSMMFHSPWKDILFLVNNIFQGKGLVWDISNLILQEKHGLRQKQENQILYCTPPSSRFRRNKEYFFEWQILTKRQCQDDILVRHCARWIYSIGDVQQSPTPDLYCTSGEFCSSMNATNSSFSL